MSLGAAVTLMMIGAGAIQFLVVASFALARRRLHLTWLAANCIVATGYSLACFLSVSPWMPEKVTWHCGHLGYSMAALYFLTMIQYLDVSRQQVPRHWERWIHYSLLSMAVLIWMPGLFFTPGHSRSWTFLWTTHTFPASNSLLWICGLVVVAGIALLIHKLLPCPRALRIAGLFFALCAAHDVCVSLGVWQVTWVAAMGILVFLAVLSQQEAKAWAAEANLLTAAKVTLESRVAERSAELAASRDELAKHERLAALGRMAASVGHEINNPLTYVMCNLQLLRSKCTNANQSIDDAIEGANRIARIVEQLRLLSRTAKRRDQEVLDLSDVLKKSVKTLRHQLSTTTQIKMQCAPSCYIKGDVDRLTQLMVNLLSNALASISDKTSDQVVEVTTFADGAEVVAQIRDHGCGIPESIQESLFEPFTTTRRDGLGLGLAISQMIADEAGAKLTFSSEIDIGSTFELRFPKCDPPTAPSARDEVAQFEVPAQCRVLVVDDEPAVLTSFQRILDGCDVTTASNGDAATRLLATEEFDVIFCDVVMPGLSGVDVLKQFRQSQNGKFVLMSGGNPNDEIQAERLVDIPFLPKPFGVADVIAHLPRSPSEQSLHEAATDSSNSNPHTN